MLRQVSVPVLEIADMKPTHLKVLVGLLSFADRFGKCWPQLRTLAETISMSVTSVQRAITEMKEAGNLSVRRRVGRSSVYRIAKRFLPQFRNRNTETKAPPPSPADSPVRSCSDIGTEGVAKKERQQESKEETGLARRSAPPQVKACFDRSGPNPFARKAWLTKLNAFIGERLRSDAQWQGWELIAAAQAGTLDRGQQRQLDWLDKQMRACGYRPAG